MNGKLYSSVTVLQEGVTADTFSVAEAFGDVRIHTPALYLSMSVDLAEALAHKLLVTCATIKAEKAAKAEEQAA